MELRESHRPSDFAEGTGLVGEASEIHPTDGLRKRQESRDTPA